MAYTEKPKDTSRDWICVDQTKEGRWFRDFNDKSKYIELATTLVSFLTPVPAGQERARTVSMIRWMVAFVRTQSGNDKDFDKVAEIVGRIVDGDYVQALTQAAVMLQARCDPDEAGPKQERCTNRMTRAIQLVGAIASYARTYQDTRALDPAEARKARKEALEGLIDAATDRENRGADFVVSLGSNVGIGAFVTVPRETDGSFASHADYAPAVRVPLGVSMQWLPEGEEERPGGARSEYIGWHLGLTIADLGQFLATDDDGVVDDVRWSNFVAPGAEFGMLIGDPSSLLTISVSAAYAPSLFETTDSASGEMAQGAWRFGATLGYYVPFIDFN